MFLSDLSLFSTLELSVAVMEELRVKPESESESVSVSSGVLIVSELELEPTEISIRVLKVVSVSSSIYQ
jgi:hypothetical protein